jgi:hypothetical protein
MKENSLCYICLKRLNGNQFLLKKTSIKIFYKKKLMKYALCFRGIHYVEPIKQYGTIDFEDSFNNIKQFLLNDIHDYDMFISSYHSKKEEKLLETYKPKKYIFTDFNVDEINFKAQLVHHFNCVQMILQNEEENNMKYDMILITRFDYIYFRKFYEMNLDLTKFNIAMKHSSGNCDDNFWLLPRYMLDNFTSAIVHLYQTGGITHAINHLFNATDIHYMYIIDINDYDNFTTYQYFAKNNFELDKIIEQLNKHKNMNLNRIKLLV